MRLMPGVEGVEPLIAVRRLTSEEAALGELHIHPDLTALEELALADLVLDGGGEAVFDHEVEPCALAGPSGWLGADIAAGDVAVLRWDGATLHVTCGPEAPAYDEVATARLGRWLVAAFEADQLDVHVDDLDEPDDDEGEDIEFSGIGELCVIVAEEHPGAFATLVPPLSEVLADAGLEVHGELVGRPGTSWETLEQVEDFIEELTSRRAEHVRSSAAFAAVEELLIAFEDDGAASPDEARRLAGLFAVEPGVATAVADEIVSHGEALGDVEVFARRLLDASRGTAAAGAAWLLGAVAEELGDLDAHERWLHRSLVADRSYLPALVDSSWYASDRGDASRALTLLSAVGIGEEDSWYRRLAGFARPGPLSAGRNDPCPCGSGRKHKACCARTNGWPLAARAAWLYDKAAAYLDRPYASAGLGDLFALDELDEHLRLDLALFEGGVLAEFVEVRGRLLPEDERALAASWIGGRRRVVEVVEVRPGEGLTLEDVVDGETWTIVERSGSRSLQPHQLVHVRLLPSGDGDGVAIFGPVIVVTPGVAREVAARLAEGSAVDIAQAWIASRRPPVMTTADGEPLVLARAVYEVDDDAARESLSLAGVFGDDVDFEVAGRRVVVRAVSDRALRELEERLVEAAPSARLVDRSVLPATAELARRMGARRAAAVDDDDGGFAGSEEDAALLRGFLREREERWVDEPLPALGGRSAREACRDDEGRREVLRLLASFGPAQPTGMDPERLRSLLGL